jgi:hypothetical protein
MDSETDPHAHEHEAITADDVRMRRDGALAASDWTQTADSPVDRQAWATYRQQLRDLPTADGWPFVNLPHPPA